MLSLLRWLLMWRLNGLFKRNCLVFAVVGVVCISDCVAMVVRCAAPLSQIDRLVFKWTSILTVFSVSQPFSIVISIWQNMFRNFFFIRALSEIFFFVALRCNVFSFDCSLCLHIFPHYISLKWSYLIMIVYNEI